MWWIFPIILGLSQSSTGSGSGPVGPVGGGGVTVISPGPVFPGWKSVDISVGAVENPVIVKRSASPPTYKDTDTSRIGVLTGTGLSGKSYDFTALAAKVGKSKFAGYTPPTEAEKAAKEAAMKAASTAKVSRTLSNLENSTDPFWRSAARMGSMSIESMRGYEGGRALLARFGY